MGSDIIQGIQVFPTANIFNHLRLHELDNLLRQGGSHDKVIWVGPGRTAEDNISNLNVRVQTKVCGRLDVSSIKYLQWMSTWKKTVFCLRENRWSITEREVPAWTKNNLVPGTRLVVFLQAPCDAYKALL